MTSDVNTSMQLHHGQLSYVGHGCETIPIQFASSAVIRIDLSDNQLRSLHGLEKFDYVEELVLDQNGLSDEGLQTIPRLRRLHTLSLNKNNITDLDGLLALIKDRLPSLTYLSLLCNAACPDQLSASDKDDDDYRRYRLYVLCEIPQLKFLDFRAVSTDERLEAAQKGPYLRVVRPSLESLRDNVSSGDDNKLSPSDDYQPLPQKLRDSMDTRATFGKCKYVYYGRHSEGNRFIKNSDL
jgi:hypothetical protein